MDAAARKSFEIQAEARHTAQHLQSTMKELYDWEREMKKQEKNLQNTPAPISNGIGDTKDLKTLPVRSHVLETKATTNKQQPQQQRNKQTKPNSSKQPDSLATTPDEKIESAPDPEVQKLKDANEIKDRGNRHVKFLQYDLAIEEYNAAIELCPKEAVFYNNRAFCYLKMEKYEQCIEDCDRAIALDCLAVKAFYRRMQANECLGNFMDALHDCTSALAIEPRNADTKKSLERINERLRKNQKSAVGPSFSPNDENFVEIHPIEKPPYKRSNKSLRRVPIADVIGPKETKTFQNLEISDDDIDKLFNSNCGPIVEVKKDTSKPTTPVTPVEEQKTLLTKPPLEKATEKEITKPTTPLNTVKEQKSSLENATEKIDKPKDIEKKEKISPESKKKKSNAEKPKTETVVPVTAKNIEAKKAEKLEVSKEVTPFKFITPTSTAQFYTNWKELPDNHKFQYLKSIDVKQLKKILGAGFDSDTLKDCLRIIHDFYLPNNESATSDTLLEISRNEEVSILSLFMSAADKKVLSKIMEALKNENSTPEETLNAINSNFNLI